MSDRNRVTLSVIVPTKDSEATLEPCLKSVREQCGNRCELIVVDNFSSDETPSIAGKWSDKLLTVGPERSAQRNAGASIASGDIFVFIDSDMTVDAGLLEEIASTFDRNSRLDALVLPERSVGVGFWGECRSLEKQLYVGDSSVEAARCFRRGVFIAAGGYDEALHAGEDWDLPDRVSRAGGLIGRVDLGVTHDEGLLSLRALFKKKRYYGLSLGTYVRKQPRSAARRMFRVGAMRGLPQLGRRPLHAAGLVFMKLVELAAVIVGMSESLVRSKRRAASSGFDDGA